MWSATIIGELASAKNSRRLVPRKTKKGKTYLASIKSDKAQGWLAGAMVQVKRPKIPIGGDVALNATVYYASRRPDLDIALLMDFLQSVGVIVNDRQIIEQHIFKKLDKLNPRVNVMVIPVCD